MTANSARLFFVSLCFLLMSCQTNVGGPDEAEDAVAVGGEAVATSAALTLPVNEDLFHCWRTYNPNRCPKLVASGAPGLALEPSGVTFARLGGQEIFVGVTDNVNDLVAESQRRFGDLRLKKYAIFAFHPTDPLGRAPNGNILAFPLLTDAQVNQFPLYDLEGIAFNPINDSAFYAISSLSRYKRAGTNREYLDRKQAYRFQVSPVRPGGLYTVNNVNAVNMSIVIPPREQNVQNWVFSATNQNLFKTNMNLRAETEGGLNVEGVAIAGNIEFEDYDRNRKEGPGFVIGFRGPVLGGPQYQGPGAYSTTYRIFQTSKLTTGDYTDYGVRGIESLAAFRSAFRGNLHETDLADWFVVILGPSGTAYGPSMVCIAYMPDILNQWSLGKNGGDSCQRFYRDDFVAEGVAPIAVDIFYSSGPPNRMFNMTVTVLVVDDVGARLAKMTLHCDDIPDDKLRTRCAN